MPVALQKGTRKAICAVGLSTTRFVRGGRDAEQLTANSETLRRQASGVEDRAERSGVCGLRGAELDFFLRTVGDCKMENAFLAVAVQFFVKPSLHTHRNSWR
jgi:hypothetical protein